MFALDVFGEGRGFWQTLAALTMHLVPTFALLAALVVAWRWERTGASLFGAYGIGSLIIVRGPWWVRMIFALPCLVAAGLFFVCWLKLAELEPKP
jgi:hypothetical protein